MWCACYGYGETVKKETDERVVQELNHYPNQDVLVFYQRGVFKITWGFYIWNGNNHTATTFTELREDGFEKEDIKELRSEASRFTVIEKSLGELEVILQ
jgi:hypothetical protein